MKRTKAFTLVELLVVVAILTLLASIIMPSFGKAKEAARRAVCAVHIRGCGQATILYAVDYNGRLPMVEMEVEGVSDMPSWNAQVTYDWWGGKAGEYGSYLSDTGQRLINPYIGRTGAISETDSGILEIFHCPSDKGSLKWNGNYYGPTEWDFCGSSYLYNSTANCNEAGPGLWRKKIAQITNPAKVIIANGLPFNCYFNPYYRYDWISPDDPYLYTYWHDRDELGWANVVFVDGHVAYLQATADNPDFQNGPNWTFLYNGG